MSEQTRHTVDPRFTYIERRNNKEVVLYVGLLDAAHRGGLVGIHTEILQFPHPDNDMTCIVRALAQFRGRNEDDGRQYSGIGDANPQNVGKNIAPHFIRMAETRAKARALRDALNVGMLTAEELGGEDDDGNAASKLAQSPARAAETRQVAPYAPELREPAPAPSRASPDHARERPEERAKEADWNDVWKLAKSLGINDRQALQNALGANPGGMDCATIVRELGALRDRQPAGLAG